ATKWARFGDPFHGQAFGDSRIARVFHAKLDELPSNEKRPRRCASGPPGPGWGNSGHFPAKANWPRSTLTKRDCLPLVAISLRIEAKSVACGVLPPGDFQ